MPEPGPFGPFEVSRELETSTGATVYRARKEGETKDDYVVKVFSLERQVTEEGQAPVPELETLFHDLGASFTSRIQLQKAAADASPYFAPILAGGHDERGPWYVTRFYGRSIKGMLGRLIALEGADLYHIANSVVQAALHLKRAAGRSHGNLKPSNVFVEGLGKPRESAVRVTDPLAGEAADAPAYELADLRAIGELIYQLALKRKVDFTWVMVPLDVSPDWKRLFGDQSAAWLDLCNRLLDPRLSLESMSLERVEADLQKLRPKRNLTPVLAAAAGVVLLAALGAHFIFKPSDSIQLAISTDPPGAEVHVRLASTGEDVRGSPFTAKGKVKRKLTEEGDYAVRAKYPDLADVSTSLHLVKGVRTNLQLRFEYGKLVVNSVPPGATFFKGPDGKSFKTDHTFDVFRPGTTNVELSLDGYQIGSANVTIPSGGQVARVEVTLHELEAGQKNIEFSSDPPGARFVVRMNGQVVNELLPGATKVTLPSGKYEVAAALPGWPAQTKPLSVEARSGETASGQFPFRFEHGTLSLGPNLPPGLKVVVTANEGSFTSTNIAPSLAVPVGGVQVLFSAAGYKPATTNFSLGDRESRQLAPHLETLGGWVEVVTDPAGAAIYDLNGAEPTQPLPLEEGRVTLRPGAHQLKASYPGLADVSGDVFNVQAAKAGPRQVLPFKYGRLTFTNSQPEEVSAASLQKEGGGEVAFGDLIRQPPAQAVTYSLKLEGYEPWRRSITLTDREARLEPVRLERVRYPVQLASIPEESVRYWYLDRAGQEQPLANGSALSWGTNTVIARCGNLPEQRRVAYISRSGSGAKFDFEFRDYGVANTKGLAGVKEVALADPPNWTWQPPANIYVRPGTTKFILRYPSGFSETLTTNVPPSAQGAVFLASSGRPPYTNEACGMVFVWVKGLPDSDRNPVGGYVGKYEVTQGQYTNVMRTDPSSPDLRLGTQALGPGFPVNNFEPADAVRFCERLTQQDAKGGKYSLPTVEQWRFFATGGASDLSNPNLRNLTNGAIMGLRQGPREIGNITENANPYQLCDVLGNFSELCMTTGSPQGYASLGGDYTSPTRPTFQIADPFGNLFRPKQSPKANVGFRVVYMPGTSR